MQHYLFSHLFLRFITNMLPFRSIPTLGALISLIHISEQKSTVNPTFNVTIFNTTVDFRQNVCNRHERFSRGEIDLKDALEGMSIHPILGKSSYLHLEDDGYTIADPNPGLVVEILDEVARRGNFVWRDTFAITEWIDTEGIGKSWTDLLIWETDVYDISINWWLHNPERVALGATFPKGWYDASIIMVGVQEGNEESDFDALSWKKPFTNGVWLMMIITLVISGLTSFYLDEYEKKQMSNKKSEDKQETVLQNIVRLSKKGLLEKKESISSSIHKSFIVFTGHMDLDAISFPGQLVAFSLSFFAMLMLSAYTANLATSLVVTSIPRSTINDITDIIGAGLKMCIMSDSAFEESIRQNYNGANFVRKSTDKDIIDGLNNGECDYAITSMTYWKEAQASSQHNKACNLTQIGRMVETYEAGFASKSDAGTRCTSLIRDVFDAHLREMRMDGFLDKTWNMHFSKRSDVACSEPNEVGFDTNTSDITQQLSIKGMGGIFILHFVFLGIACILSALTKWKARKHEERKRRELVLGEDADDAVVSHDSVTPPTTLNTVANELNLIKLEQSNMQSNLTDEMKLINEKLETVLKHLNSGKQCSKTE